MFRGHSNSAPAVHGGQSKASGAYILNFFPYISACGGRGGGLKIFFFCVGTIWMVPYKFSRSKFLWVTFLWEPDHNVAGLQFLWNLEPKRYLQQNIFLISLSHNSSLTLPPGFQKHYTKKFQGDSRRHTRLNNYPKKK